MKRYIPAMLCTLGALLMVVAASCTDSKDEPAPPAPKESTCTVLVYMAADTNLGASGYDTDDIDEMIAASFVLENSESEGQWMSGNEVVAILCRNYSQLKSDSGLKLRLGKALRYLGCKAKHTKRGQEYLLSARQ